MEAVAEGGWELFPFHDSPEFRHEELTRQPGEPTSAQWDLVNPDAGQELQFKLRVAGEGGSVSNPSFEVDRSAALVIPIEVKPGQSLLLEKDGIARLYDAKGSQLKSLPAALKIPRFAAGKNHIDFQCDFQGTPSPKVAVTFKTRGVPVQVPLAH